MKMLSKNVFLFFRVSMFHKYIIAKKKDILFNPNKNILIKLFSGVIALTIIRKISMVKTEARINKNENEIFCQKLFICFALRPSS